MRVAKSYPAFQCEEFKRLRVEQMELGIKCEAIARSTGKRCGQIAMMGATRCRHHKGHFAAVKEEERRHKMPVIVMRKNADRKGALARLGCEPWPDGLPRLPRLTQLGPLARGRLFEAWYNREMAPALWRYELERERVRTIMGPDGNKITTRSGNPDIKHPGLV
jgi:hypothetical protein